MNERIFAKLRAGSSRKKDEKSAKCPTQPELENGGNSLIADAVSSDKDASAKYVTTPVVPTNYDPSAIDIPDATQPNKWHDLQTLTLADETQRKAAKLLETYSDVTSAKFRKLSNILSRSNAEQAHEVIESLTSGLDVGLGNDEEDDRILIKFDEAARKVRIFVYFHCTLNTIFSLNILQFVARLKDLRLLSLYFDIIFITVLLYHAQHIIYTF